MSSTRLTLLSFLAVVILGIYFIPRVYDDTQPLYKNASQEEQDVAVLQDDITEGLAIIHRLYDALAITGYDEELLTVACALAHTTSKALLNIASIKGDGHLYAESLSYLEFASQVHSNAQACYATLAFKKRQLIEDNPVRYF